MSFSINVSLLTDAEKNERRVEGNFVGHRGVDIKRFRSFFVDLTTGVDIVKAEGSVFGGNMEKSL